MNDKPMASAPGLNLGDILYVIFRHKWKIAFISTLGVVGAALIYVFWPVPYQSEARLLVKYMVDRKLPVEGQAVDEKVKIPSDRGNENVINNEIEILTSLDLARQVVTALKADLAHPDIVAKLGGQTNELDAAVNIQSHLLVESSADVPKDKTAGRPGGKSDVIHLIFTAGDPNLTVPVLKQVVDTYLVRQAEIHRPSTEYDTWLTRRCDELRNSLHSTEELLRTEKGKIGGFGSEETKKIYFEQMAKLQESIFDTGAALAEKQAEIEVLKKFLPMNPEAGPSAAPAATNVPAPTSVAIGSNVPAPAVVTAATNAPVAVGTPPTNTLADVPPDKVAEYKEALTGLDALRRKQRELLLEFKPETPLVKNVRDQIAVAEKQKERIEAENPGLVAPKVEPQRTYQPAPRTTSGVPAVAGANPGSRIDLMAEVARVPALESKFRFLTNNLERIRTNAAVVQSEEGQIAELEQARKDKQGAYEYFQKSLDNLKADSDFDAGRSANIKTIQEPSPPGRDSAKRLKVMVLVLVGGIAGAFGLAFLIDFVLDPTVRRPLEVESRLGLPLFISIPRLSLRNGHAPELLTPGRRLPQLPAGNAQPAPTAGAEATPGSAPALPETGAQLATSESESVVRVVPWDPRNKLRPFSEALRDRLITFFEVKNLTHKPKLVAVSSCAAGAGVSTIAASLAATLSETGDGNVLFVDMNHQGTAHQFFHGDLACLDDALETEKREEAMVQDNLYVVSEVAGNRELPRALPKRFKHLVPRLKASDYDYIIFDMPPISQISVTPRLARFMDMVLVVVESEKTDREVVKRAGSILAEAQTNVAIVLNKSRAYLPRRLTQEF